MTKLYYISYSIANENNIISLDKYCRKKYEGSDSMVFNTCGTSGRDRSCCSIEWERWNLRLQDHQDVRSVLEVSESTLGPVLWRLQKDKCLETYDQALQVETADIIRSQKRHAQLNLYRVEWRNYSTKISKLFEGGIELWTECSLWNS